MPIYSYPGVYLQEVSTSAHPIEGVSTTPRESAFPGVYLEESPASVHPIDGVATTTHAPAAASRLPAHTPEWTNPNAGDPGVTLVELFAFLAESLIYRADLIPARHPDHVLQAAPDNAQNTALRFPPP